MILKQKMDQIVKFLHWYNNFMGYSTSYSMPPYAHYINMGNFCLPRSFLTEWGIKPRKASGELSMPFDLMHIDPIALNYFLLFNFFVFSKIFDWTKKRLSFVEMVSSIPYLIMMPILVRISAN